MYLDYPPSSQLAREYWKKDPLGIKWYCSSVIRVSYIEEFIFAWDGSPSARTISSTIVTRNMRGVGEGDSIIMELIISKGRHRIQSMLKSQ